MFQNLQRNPATNLCTHAKWGRTLSCRIIAFLDSIPRRRFLIAVSNFYKVMQVAVRMFGGVPDMNRFSHLSSTLASSQLPRSADTIYFRFALLPHAQPFASSNADALSTLSLSFKRPLCYVLTSYKYAHINRNNYAKNIPL